MTKLVWFLRVAMWRRLERYAGSLWNAWCPDDHTVYWFDHVTSWVMRHRDRAERECGNRYRSTAWRHMRTKNESATKRRF